MIIKKGEESCGELSDIEAPGIVWRFPMASREDCHSCGSGTKTHKDTDNFLVTVVLG
jgi:hypothetical protein